MKAEKPQIRIGEIIVQNCQECGKDNWTYPSIEIICKHSKKSLWLCRGCAIELSDLITEMVKT